MPTHTIPYKKTGYFSKLITDYLEENKNLKSFYNRFPSLKNFEDQIEEKKKNFSSDKRHLLATRIMYQYGDNRISQYTLSNIDLLKENTTFTVTTGHQLNLFTGPLYFLYKIFSTINLCETLKKAYPSYNFVPIYWMASEDHDFEEINHFNLFRKKIEWNRESSGAVGLLSLSDLDEVKEKLKRDFGEGENGKKLFGYFSDAYSKHTNLANATRYLADKLFNSYGLVIVDGNDEELKKCFVPYAENELNEGLGFSEISKTTQRLTDRGYPEQVHPREINLFYLKENLRERIIERDKRFYINDTDISFSKEEILKDLHENPQHFSPNALLRPLYQEVILPNLCYIGGGGELAYWFQLKDYFNKVEIPFPILLLRNSVLLVPKRISDKLEKIKIDVNDLFLPQHELLTQQTHNISPFHIDFSKQKSYLKKQFQDLYKIAKKTDASFIGAVAAQEKKQLKGLDNLEKRLLKAQKRKHSEELEKLRSLQEELFPNHSLQERDMNFSEFYLEYGDALLEVLKDELDPLDMRFKIFQL